MWGVRWFLVGRLGRWLRGDMRGVGTRSKARLTKCSTIYLFDVFMILLGFVLISVACGLDLGWFADFYEWFALMCWVSLEKNTNQLNPAGQVGREMSWTIKIHQRHLKNKYHLIVLGLGQQNHNHENTLAMA